MKNNQWNPQAKDSDTNVATMPAPVPIKNDAAFDKLRYQPTPRVCQIMACFLELPG